MKAVQLDITLEIPMSEDDIAQTGESGFWRQVLERMKHDADEEAAKVGGRVVTDRMPEVAEPRFAERASGIFVGGTSQWLLCASRWWVEVPESFDVHTAART
jgi:hypothetical protein